MGTKTHIVMVLDESGSMNHLQDDVIGGYNQFLKDQLKVKGKLKVSLIKFSSGIHTVFTNVKLKDVRPLTAHDYIPGGMTALYDAIGTAMNVSRDTKADKKIVMVQTDGYENQSREFNHETINSLIENSPEIEVIFLGANIDAKAVGSDMGMKRNSTMSTAATSMGTRSAYQSVSENLASYRTGVKKDMSFEAKDIKAQEEAKDKE